MVPCGSSPVTRFALASAMRKTKRLRRRLEQVIERTMKQWVYNKLDPTTIKHLTDNDSPYPCLVITPSLALIRCVFAAASLNIIFEKSQIYTSIESAPSLSQLKCRVNRLGVVSWCSGWFWSPNDVIQKTKKTPKTPAFRKPRST